MCLQEKCHQYWPTERSARYQYFVVDPTAEYNMPQYILREFKVTDARVGIQLSFNQLNQPHISSLAVVFLFFCCYFWFCRMLQN